MNIQKLLELSNQYPQFIIAYFCLPPILAWLLKTIHGPKAGNNKPWKYIYAILVYLVCIPGTIAFVLTAYSIFIIHQNLLQVNALIYFLPIISMAFTLALINKAADFSKLPGFERLSGMIALIAVSFIIILMLYKTRIFIGFFGSFEYLLILGVVIYIFLTWSWNKLSGNKE